MGWRSEGTGYYTSRVPREDMLHTYWAPTEYMKDVGVGQGTTMDPRPYGVHYDDRAYSTAHAIY